MATEGGREKLVLLAIDPGRQKCGVAVVEAGARVLHQEVVGAAEVGEVARDLLARYGVTQLVLGDRTAAKGVRQALREAGVSLTPTVVDEHRSSEEGRRRYFQANPPRGWRRLLPVTLQTPPGPYDDYVAVVLAERYVRSRGGG